MKIIFIDSGTTNSRIRLVDGKESNMLDAVKIQIGVRNTAIDGDNRNLIKQLKQGIQSILETNEITSADIRYIVASGMITSNLGVYEVPHISGPASIVDFAANSVEINLEDFFNIPCILIPGMKNAVTEDNTDSISAINDYDVMRGEEVETFGLLNQINVQGNGVMVLPGSHTKYVAVDEEKRLTSCLSTLAGEILTAVQKETILSNSIGERLIDVIDKGMLEKGFESAKKYGLTRTFYHIRLLQLFSELDENGRANYFAGAVIYDDVRALLQTINNKELKWIIVGGSNPLRQVFVHLLNYLDAGWKIIEASDEQAETSMVIGAKEVASKYMDRTDSNENV